MPLNGQTMEKMNKVAKRVLDKRENHQNHVEEEDS